MQMLHHEASAADSPSPGACDEALDDCMADLPFARVLGGGELKDASEPLTQEAISGEPLAVLQAGVGRRLTAERLDFPVS